jgi:hypothetical protein
MWIKKIKQILRWLQIPSVFSFVIILGQLNGTGSSWSAPDTIPGYHPETNPPVLVADQNRTVHAFSSQWIGEGTNSARVIMYNRWTYNQGWTLPVDILLSPLKEARLLDAYLDPTGMMHLAFWGGDNTYANIYYTRSLAIEGDDPRAWLAPVLVAPNAGDPESGVILWDDHDNLGIVFHGRNLGEGIYVIFSSDAGGSWSDAAPIFLSDSAGLYPTRLKSWESESGLSHIVWNMGDESGQGRGVYYTSIDPSSADWGEPLMLDASPEGLGTDRPAVIEHQGVLYVIYINMGIKMRTSTDGGLSWGSITKLFTRHVGYNGSLSPVIDGNGDLHLFFGQRITGSPDIHGMWHSQLLNYRWTEPDAIVKGPAVHDMANYSGFDPYQAQAIVSQGSTILVTWRTDPGLRGNGVWYSYMKLNAPETPAVPLPEKSGFSEIGSTMVSSESVDEIHLVSSQLSEDLNMSSPEITLEPNMVIIYGVLTASMLVLATIISKVRGNRRL